jgi:hypothetical protein
VLGAMVSSGPNAVRAQSIVWRLEAETGIAGEADG